MHANLRVHVKTGEEKYLTDAFDVLNNFSASLSLHSLPHELFSDAHARQWITTIPSRTPRVSTPSTSSHPPLLTLRLHLIISSAYSGLNDECTSTGHPQTWTYNQGVMLSTFGLLYKATGEQQYFDRGNELINAVRTSSSANGVLVEVMCDEEGTCNFDQEGFKVRFFSSLSSLCGSKLCLLTDAM